MPFLKKHFLILFLSFILFAGIISLSANENFNNLIMDYIIPKGSLLITTQPNNELAYIYIDSAYQGKTSLEIKRIPVGRHTVKIEKEGYKDYLQEFEIEAQKTTSIMIKLGDRANYLETGTNIEIVLESEEKQESKENSPEEEITIFLNTLKKETGIAFSEIRKELISFDSLDEIDPRSIHGQSIFAENSNLEEQESIYNFLKKNFFTMVNEGGATVQWGSEWQSKNILCSVFVRNKSKLTGSDGLEISVGCVGINDYQELTCRQTYVSPNGENVACISPVYTNYSKEYWENECHDYFKNNNFSWDPSMENLLLGENIFAEEELWIRGEKQVKIFEIKPQATNETCGRESIDKVQWLSNNSDVFVLTVGFVLDGPSWSQAYLISSKGEIKYQSPKHMMSNYDALILSPQEKFGVFVMEQGVDEIGGDYHTLEIVDIQNQRSYICDKDCRNAMFGNKTTLVGYGKYLHESFKVLDFTNIEDISFVNENEIKISIENEEPILWKIEDSQFEQYSY